MHHHHLPQFTKMSNIFAVCESATRIFPSRPGRSVPGFWMSLRAAALGFAPIPEPCRAQVLHRLIFLHGLVFSPEIRHVNLFQSALFILKTLELRKVALTK